MKTVLYTADIHLTMNPRDEYRWEIFPWLMKQVEQRDIGAVVIAGDLTDAKDNHPSSLVNRLTRCLSDLAAMCPVHVLMGNHDYIDHNQPFFDFLGIIKDVHFYKKVTAVEICGREHVFIPHTTCWVSSAKEVTELTGWRRPYRFVIHQAILGAYERGHKVEGTWSNQFTKTKRAVIAGDIHTPQWIGDEVIYCGSPHPVKFGEEHKPRVLLDEGGPHLRSLNRATVRKRILEITVAEQVKNRDLMAGDMVRVNFTLPRREFVAWPEHKAAVLKYLEKLKVDVYGVRLITNTGQHPDGRVKHPAAEVRTPADVLVEYGKSKKLDVSTGLALLASALDKKPPIDRKPHAGGSDLA